MSYHHLVNIHRNDLSDRKVLLIGAGAMGREYCNALKAMKIKHVTVISRTTESASRCAGEFGFETHSGGFEKVLPQLGVFDLVIISTPIDKLRQAANLSIKQGNKSILIEKPGELYSQVLNQWSEELANTDVRVRLAYNRIVYPSLWKAKELAERDGGVSSCFYTFTEWVHKINFSRHSDVNLRRWGITNSSHVMSMAHYLIGMPEKLSSFKNGSLPWHPNGSGFTGAGVTGKGVLFSYHANWTSAGRWGVELMTPQNAYRLIPLEELYMCKKGSVDWTPVELAPSYPQVKSGIAEEIAIMLLPDLEKDIPLVTVDWASELTTISEMIFDYDKRAVIKSLHSTQRIDI